MLGRYALLSYFEGGLILVRFIRRDGLRRRVRERGERMKWVGLGKENGKVTMMQDGTWRMRDEPQNLSHS